MVAHKKHYKTALTDNTARFIINAANVHNGGGAELLKALIETKPDVVYVDQRFDLPKKLTNFTKIEYIEPSLIARLKHEMMLNKLAGAKDIVLFFGNLPPLFPLKAHTVVFVQNRYLIDTQSIRSFDFKTKLRIILERLWLFYRRDSSSLYCVQTCTMANLLRKTFKNEPINIKIAPFIGNDKMPSQARAKEQLETKKSGFIYVASGEPHKNHDRLIKAWMLLAEMNHFPKLKLTLDKNQWPDLCAWIEAQKQTLGLDIENLGFLRKEALSAEYRRSMALIYPSKFESFGMPLLEAQEEEIPIIASELDYVRDIVQPTESFDANSELSIARAVMRFINDVEDPVEIMSAKDFVKTLKDELIET